MDLPVGRVRFGLVLPHFGDLATWTRLFGFAGEIEALGYDSVWVRDHLSYEPLALDNPGRRFVDPFTTLSGVAALTSRLRLGMSVLVPFRHPVVVAQLLGGLSFLSQGRLELGVAPGTPRKPWDVLGAPFERRAAWTRETVEVLRLLGSARGPVSYEGESASFQDVFIDPAPPADLFVWYGGGSRQAIRAAVEYCDGLLPSRCPSVRLDGILAEYQERAGQAQRPMHVGVLPLTVLAGSRAEALSRVSVPSLIDALQRRWKLDLDGVGDLDGALIAGSSTDCIEQLSRLVDRGIELMLVDLRLMGDDFEAAARAFATEVMPAFAQARPATPFDASRAASQ
jgi:alkanesulfonate monooxygenase SsuD/methylene tetrahydromethanopterin reductase-like flavin-dependent oxidoreductase (luciferase family)